MLRSAGGLALRRPPGVSYPWRRRCRAPTRPRPAAAASRLFGNTSSNTSKMHCNDSRTVGAENMKAELWQLVRQFQAKTQGKADNSTSGAPRTKADEGIMGMLKNIYPVFVAVPLGTLIGCFIIDLAFKVLHLHARWGQAFVILALAEMKL